MRTLKCYAEGQPGRWEAICLDLDIGVQGGSLEEVFRSLNEAIELYLESLHELPHAERERFLHRSMPLSLRLKFLFHVIRTMLSRRSGPDDKTRAEFLIPCAA
jgi:hypothetical protein